MAISQNGVHEIVTKSWFATFANPVDHGYPGTPQEVCERLRDEWIGDSTTRSGAWAYCVSNPDTPEAFPHIHMVLEDRVAMRFSAIKRSYAAGAHFEATKGRKTDTEDYIYKRRKYAEKGEVVLCVVTAGTILGAQGKRSDLETISILLEEGKNPQEIMDTAFAFRRFSKEIKEAYFRKRWLEVPPIRDVRVHTLVGDSGTGKTQTYAELCEEYGEDNVCMVSDYANGGFDHYAGERILFLDEYRGQLPYSTFLTLTDRYKTQLHARYTNIWTLWSEVYISSIYPPEALYDAMVAEGRRAIDTRVQMYRRITDITYCYKDVFGEYRRYTIPMSEYKNYADLKSRATRSDILSLF